MKHFLKKSALAAAALASFGAQAVVITFDQPVTNFNAPDAPLYTYLAAGTEFQTQGFWFDPYSAQTARQDGDLVGALVDGADSANVCSVLVVCPSNPTGTFYAALNDGYLLVGANSGSPLRLVSFSASFIGAQGETFPAVSAILRISAVSAANVTLATQDYNLSGGSAGVLSFAQFTASGAIATTNAAFYRLRAAACDSLGSCSFTSTNKGQYAIDNLNIAVVPEPAQWALFGLGLAGVAAIARRRRSV